MDWVTSGIAGLDEMLDGGLALGDNIVWVADDRADLAGACRAFLAATETGSAAYIGLSGAAAPADLPPEATRHEVVVSDDPASRRALERLLTDGRFTEGSRIVVDGLDDLVARWGAAETVAFYRRACPRLLDLGVVAYWTGSRAMLSSATIDGIAKIAQCVFDRRGDRLRIAKAEGRPARVQGALVEIAEGEDGHPVVVREHAVGRLGEGLRRIRRERNLSQGQIAALAGITPAAISQAETGRRGLSLDTLVLLCDALGTTLDDLMGSARTVDHVLVRHDRRRSGAPSDGHGDPVALFDDPAAGVRSYLVSLGPEQEGSPAFAHKGVEMVLVADGLVLVDLGEQTPVMRAGDALMVSRVPIRSWCNLGSDPARLFWVVSG